MKAAIKAGDKRRLGVIRLINAAIKQREVDERVELDDTQVLVVLDKMLKQRRDSISQFEQAGREDLAAQERFEVDVCQEYMPAPLSEAEIDALISQAIDRTGATGMRDMGKVMGLLKPTLQGRADMAVVSQQIKARLGGSRATSRRRRRSIALPWGLITADARIPHDEIAAAHRFPRSRAPSTQPTTALPWGLVLHGIPHHPRAQGAPARAGRYR